MQKPKSKLRRKPIKKLRSSFPDIDRELEDARKRGAKRKPVTYVANFKRR
jgi:hypothetical protein